MNRGTLATVLVFALLLALALLLSFGPSAPDGDYNRTTVHLEDEDGTRLATVDVRIADTPEKRYLGLSNTTSLAPNEGMLFVFPREGGHVFVMRRMDFPLDIIYVSEDGTISRIHHAPVPEEIPGGNGEFPGVGKYVLEVPRGWTNATGVSVGDRLVLTEPVSADE